MTGNTIPGCRWLAIWSIPQLPAQLCQSQPTSTSGADLRNIQKSDESSWNFFFRMICRQVARSEFKIAESLEYLRARGNVDTAGLCQGIFGS
jgi:hypothetical protein